MASAKGGASLVCYALSTSVQHNPMGTHIHLDSTGRRLFHILPPVLCIFQLQD